MDLDGLDQPDRVLLVVEGPKHGQRGEHDQDTEEGSDVFDEFDLDKINKRVEDGKDKDQMDK